MSDEFKGFGFASIKSEGQPVKIDGITEKQLEAGRNYRKEKAENFKNKVNSAKGIQHQLALYFVKKTKWRR